MLRHAVETALAAVGPPAAGTAPGGPVVVVVGAAAPEVRRELDGLGVQVAFNPRWQEGLSTSIDSGLAMLEATAGVDAVLFTTCDQPQVSAALLRELTRTYAADRPPVVASSYAGTLGVPALFDRSLFPELRELRGDAGAKRVIERHLDAVAAVPAPDAALDIDTVDDARQIG